MVERMVQKTMLRFVLKVKFPPMIICIPLMMFSFEFILNIDGDFFLHVYAKHYICIPWNHIRPNLDASAISVQIVEMHAR